MSSGQFRPRGNDSRCESKLNLQIACAPFQGRAPRMGRLMEAIMKCGMPLGNDYAYLKVIKMLRFHRCEHQGEASLVSQPHSAPLLWTIKGSDFPARSSIKGSSRWMWG